MHKTYIKLIVILQNNKISPSGVHRNTSGHIFELKNVVLIEKK